MSARILQEAEHLIGGDRHASYGDYSIEAERIAEMWSVILRCKVRPGDVPLCMIAVKIVRETHAHKRDNLTDIAGYAALAQQVAEGLIEQPPTFRFDSITDARQVELIEQERAREALKRRTKHTDKIYYTQQVSDDLPAKHEKNYAPAGER